MAGSSGGSSGGKKKARIEIIPLIDVIFFLLATFVLFTLSLNKSGGVAGINLPTSDSGETRETSGTVTISVTEAGTIAWNKDFISLSEFIDRLKTFKIAEPDGRILINGDEGALFNAALYIFDEARKTGFQKVFIETKVRSASR
ncbi:ExbD/TolR family protein [Horticoccus sp. 23ND18S-11]|uniref:ExbD/TolR family protein n=1 Tax=Horticoccus sp. 23ND18S-11 TaxID=3391832 RepID=UPI0039C93AF6